MNTITLADLEVFFRVGVPEAERATPQRLLLTVAMEHDFTAAVARDDLAGTIDYFAVAQRLLRFGKNRQWALIETLASDIAAMVLAEFSPQSVSVEVKKFILPQTRHVSVAVTRRRN